MVLDTLGQNIQWGLFKKGDCWRNSRGRGDLNELRMCMENFRTYSGNGVGIVSATALAGCDCSDPSFSRAVTCNNTLKMLDRESLSVEFISPELNQSRN